MQHKTSAVDFTTAMRAHIALASTDVERSIEFYRSLLGQEPTKVRQGYAKFEVHEPPLNLSLNQTDSPARQASPAHFGVQVKSTADVLAKLAGMAKAGFDARTEEGVGCCYALQDKAWFADPDGNQWEIFVVTEADIAEHSRPVEASAAETKASAKSESGPGLDSRCCPPTCCQ